MSLITNRQRILHESPECYACDSPKTSVEHAPPECFFPETKNERGESVYRKNLITVPSCTLHNQEKSKDDLYVWFQLAAAIEGNHCAALARESLMQEMEKDRERGGKFSALILRQVRGVVPEGVIGVVDPHRMARVLGLCAEQFTFMKRFQN